MIANNRRENKKNSWISILVFLLLVEPELIPVAAFGVIIWLSIKFVSQQKGVSRASSTRQKKFDDCPQSLFCFHKDKGEHHVRKGKEIDPWDRPDIDISKYQRK